MSKPLEDAIARMLTHNKWRRGDDTVPMTDSVQLGLDIETVCKAARQSVEMRKAISWSVEYLKSCGYENIEPHEAEYQMLRDLQKALKGGSDE